MQLAIFGWQTSEVKWLRDRAANDRLTFSGAYDPYQQRFPGYYERYIETYEERYYTGKKKPKK